MQAAAPPPPPPPAFTGSEHGACGPNACMYRLAPVRPAWAERRAFAPVFLAFVLRAKVSAAPADPRFVPPRTCYHRKGGGWGGGNHIYIFLNADCATDGSGGMLCSERQFPGVETPLASALVLLLAVFFPFFFCLHVPITRLKVGEI